MKKCFLQRSRENLIQNVPLHNVLCKLLVSEKTSVQVLGKFVKGIVGRNQQGLAVLLCALSHLGGGKG